MDCINKINDIGGSIFVNVCNGDEKFLSWGVLDWLWTIGLVLSWGIFVICLGLAALVLLDWWAR